MGSLEAMRPEGMENRAEDKRRWEGRRVRRSGVKRHWQKAGWCSLTYELRSL
jgi:hypothetical protein